MRKHIHGDWSQSCRPHRHTTDRLTPYTRGTQTPPQMPLQPRFHFLLPE
jgi:hypothetical protein